MARQGMSGPQNPGLRRPADSGGRRPPATLLALRRHLALGRRLALGRHLALGRRLAAAALLALAGLCAATPALAGRSCEAKPMRAERVMNGLAN